MEVAVWRVVLPIATERRGFGGGGIIRENHEELRDAVDYISIQMLTRTWRTCHSMPNNLDFLALPKLNLIWWNTNRHIRIHVASI